MPVVGLAFALAVPILPLGNLALGAAVLYLLVALALLVVMWREPERGLLFSLGALLAPIAGLGLFPLAALAVRVSRVRRAVQAAAAVLVAAVVAGIRGAPLPFDGASAARPRDRGERRSVHAFWRPSGDALLSRPTLAVEADRPGRRRGPASLWRVPGGSGRSPGSGRGSWRLRCSWPRQRLRRRSWWPCGPPAWR